MSWYYLRVMHRVPGRADAGVAVVSLGDRLEEPEVIRARFREAAESLIVYLEEHREVPHA